MQTLLFIAAIVCSIMSQLPELLKQPTAGYLKLLWVPVGVILLWSGAKHFFGKPLKSWYTFVLVFTIYLVVLSVLTTNKYFGTDYTNIWISLLICAVSYTYWKKNASPKTLNTIGWIILLSGVLFSVTLYISYLSSIDITSRHEIYKSKNSAAQIILACGLAGYCCLKPKKFASKSFLYGILFFFIFIVFILRSRASIASLLYVFTYLLFNSRNKWVRILVISLTTIAIVVILTTPQYYNVIVENILFNNRDNNNIDDLASGRITIISDYWKQFTDHPMAGLGNFYVDCFPLSILMQFGVIGFLIVMTFVINILRKTWKIRKESMIGECSFVLYSAYLVNSLFEAQPPFGPGVKCFLVWVFIGFTFAQKNRKFRKPRIKEIPVKIIPATDK